MLLLDTCTLLWLSSDQSQLSQAAKDSIKSHSDSLFVSAITAFEIAVKCKRGKLELPIPAQDWYEFALEFHGIRELPINGKVGLASVHLPDHHNDPCDRMIIATASLHQMKILTCDKHISQYNEAEVIW